MPESSPVRDRLTVVGINKRSGAVVQRIALPERIDAPDFQPWFCRMNDNSNAVVAAIAECRKNDKYQPQRYAERMVDKALRTLEA